MSQSTIILNQPSFLRSTKENHIVAGKQSWKRPQEYVLNFNDSFTWSNQSDTKKLRIKRDLPDLNPNVCNDQKELHQIQVKPFRVYHTFEDNASY